MFEQWIQKFRQLTGLGSAAPDSFLQQCQAYEQRLAAWAQPPLPPADQGRAAVLITPWFSTSVPFLSLESACMLRRAGYEVTLLLDFTDVVGNSPNPSHELALRELCEKIGSAVRIVRPNEGECEHGPQDAAHAERIAANNAVRITWGESTARKFYEDYPEALPRLERHLGCVRALLRRERFERLLLPGGVYGLSALYLTAAEELQQPYSTYDCGAGSLRLTQNGIAAHLTDLPVVQQRLETEASAAELAQARAAAEQELSLRFVRGDARQFQATVKGQSEIEGADVLVPLNVIWDSAALGRKHVFGSCAEWLEAVLAWAAEHPQVSVCVRQHPRERVLPWKTQDNPAATVAKYAHLGSRVRFIAAGDPASTYDLLERAKVVLPHTSTVGVEAAMHGKPVVLSTLAYYGSLGFCQRPDTPAEYFRAVEEALQGAHVPDEAQRQRAALNYYLTQRCSWLQTKFTAVPDDFYEWVKRPAEQLWAEPEVADFRTALLTGENLPMVRHRRFAAAQ